MNNAQRGELGLVLVWIASALAGGFHYFPYRDDWVYLGWAARWPTGRWGFYVAHGLYGYRPLSFLVDVEVWSRFWPHATIPWAIVMALMLAAALAGRRLIARTTGRPFWLGTAMILLWPGAVEGQYWIAAASGIVLSLAAAVAAGWALAWAAEGRGRGWWWAAGLALLAADLSYEQIWGPGVVLTLAVVVHYRQPLRRALAVAVTPLVLTGAWYVAQRATLAGNGKDPVRSWAAFHAEATLVDGHFAALWGQVVWQAFAQAFAAPAMGWSWWLLIGGGTSLVMLTARQGGASAAPPAAVWMGLGLAWMVASVAPWYGTTYGWVSVRSVATTVVGLGFMAEGLLLWLAAHGARWAPELLALLVGAMLVSGASLRAEDVHAYQVTGQMDRVVAARILSAFSAHGVHHGAVALGTPVLRWVPWLYPFADHITSTASFGPALQVMLGDLTHGRDTLTFVPPGTPPPPHATGIAIVATPVRSHTIQVSGVSRGVVIRVSLHPRPRVVQVLWEGPAT